MQSSSTERLHALDATRGFALLLGVAFHATLSFMPGWPIGLWAMNDNSPSPFLSDAAFVMHVFRMSLFFFLAGFVARLLYRKLGARGFWSSRLKRILVPMVIGWVILFPSIVFVWSKGFAKMFGGPLAAKPAAAALKASVTTSPIPEVAGAFPLTHLWFLYQLLLLYAVVLALRAIIVRFDGEEKLRRLVDVAVAASVRTCTAPIVLGAPLAVALAAVPVWYYWQGIPTPDQSLIPQVPATVGFGTAFVFGWLIHRARRTPDAHDASDTLTVIEKRWIPHLLMGLVATAWLLHVVHAEVVSEPGRTKLVFAAVYGVAVWGWVLGLTGAALRFLSGFSATRRYVADASYWIYLVHLPVIAALQVWVGGWSWHWSLKFSFILVVGLLILFTSYHFLVRPTFIGLLLNGRRVRRGGRLVASAGEIPSSVTRMSGSFQQERSGAPRTAVAELRGVVKRYGTTTALDGIDLEVRRGELLAVLGPNGAGKSTAIALWLGLLEPDEGEVSLFGGSPHDLGRRRVLGVMMQDVELARELRVRELIAQVSAGYADPLTVERTLDVTGIAPIADRLYGKLSGGQKRQVQFALAICGRPRLLFLDEPTVGLDLQAREALWSNIRALLADGCSIVLTTHNLEEAEALATRVAILARGRLVATGSVEEMRALVSRRQIRCETRVEVEEVRRWEGVTDATRERGRLSITATDAEGVVRCLLASDPELRHLEVREAGLAEAFSELTKEAA